MLGGILYGVIDQIRYRRADFVHIALNLSNRSWRVRERLLGEIVKLSSTIQAFLYYLMEIDRGEI
jgi:hypothetical protein